MSTWNPPGGSSVVLEDVEKIIRPGGIVVTRLYIDVVETDQASADTDISSIRSTYLSGAVTISVTSPASVPPQDNIT